MEGRSHSDGAQPRSCAQPRLLRARLGNALLQPPGRLGCLLLVHAASSLWPAVQPGQRRRAATTDQDENLNADQIQQESPMTHIQATHLDAALDEQLRQAQVDRLIALERARDASRASRNPQPHPQSPAPPPRVAAAPPAKKTPAKKLAVKESPTRVSSSPSATLSLPQAPVLPPGSVVLSASEMEAVQYAVDYFVEHNPLPQSKERR
jgi:hypothetical protein